MKIGPALETLLRRIASADASVLLEPKLGAQGVAVVDAVVADLFESLGLVVSPEALLTFAPSQPALARKRLQITLLLVWLCADAHLRGFLQQGNTKLAQALLNFLLEVPSELAQYCNVEQLVNDVERREELARLTLARLELLPQGETAMQAQDRLSALSSAERSRVLAASRLADARAKELRAAMARKAAEEAADKMGRE
jgi:hypothetical protein